MMHPLDMRGARVPMRGPVVAIDDGNAIAFTTMQSGIHDAIRAGRTRATGAFERVRH
jgi:hypothetical protein